MKRIISALLIFVFLYIVGFNAFSFVIDGKDNGVEWDGASVYKLVDGESNCGVNFGLVKVKFDYEENALCLCFHFIDPELTVDNELAGIFLTVDDSAEFEIVASDGTLSDDTDPYCFDGAVYVDENNGATCEIRIGIKTGLPESIDFEVRFIDSHGLYSDYKNLTVINELYETTEVLTVNPTADNNDPAYNPDIFEEKSKKTTREKTSKETTKRKTTTKKHTTKSKKSETDTTFYIKTSPPYIYTGYADTTKMKTTKKNTTAVKTTQAVKTSKVKKSDTIKEKIYYYEKEIYISEVYVTQSTTVAEIETVTSADLSHTDNIMTESSVETTGQIPSVTLSKGSKYKKVIAGISMVIFIAIACYGTYSAKKHKSSSGE